MRCKLHTYGPCSNLPEIERAIRMLDPAAQVSLDTSDAICIATALTEYELLALVAREGLCVDAGTFERILESAAEG